jgi:hypothetical protein
MPLKKVEADHVRVFERSQAGRVLKACDLDKLFRNALYVVSHGVPEDAVSPLRTGKLMLACGIERISDDTYVDASRLPKVEGRGDSLLFANVFCLLQSMDSPLPIHPTAVVKDKIFLRDAQFLHLR